MRSPEVQLKINKKGISPNHPKIIHFSDLADSFEQPLAIVAVLEESLHQVTHLVRSQVLRQGTLAIAPTVRNCLELKIG